jgi:hypothetical protein
VCVCTSIHLSIQTHTHRHHANRAADNGNGLHADRIGRNRLLWCEYILYRERIHSILRENTHRKDSIERETLIGSKLSNRGAMFCSWFVFIQKKLFLYRIHTFYTEYILYIESKLSIRGAARRKFTNRRVPD